MTDPAKMSPVEYKNHLAKQKESILKNQDARAVVPTKESIEAKSELPKDRQGAVESVCGNSDYDNKPVLVPMEIETVIPEKGKTNAEIVFGRDRAGSRFGKYTSDSSAASIDIVAGRGGSRAHGSVWTQSNQLPVDPMFGEDAARIHISQKTDVDTNFKIKEHGQGISKARSAIALKADGIRLVAREGIKIVTGTDKKNSQGGDIKSVHGISIVAGNIETEVQPMVKGESLTNALKELKELNADLNAIVKQMLQAQMEFNGSLMSHFHYSTVFGNANTPSDAAVSAGGKVQVEHLQQSMRSLQVHRQNLINWDQNNLCASGKNFVLSRWNKTN